MDRTPTYTVRALRADLEHAPEAWVGRTIMVRGLVKGCPYTMPGPCGSWPPLLTDQAAASLPGFPLVLLSAHRDPLAAVLLRLPLLRNLLPTSSVILWGISTTYLLRLQVGPASTCIHAPC